MDAPLPPSPMPGPSFAPLSAAERCHYAALVAIAVLYALLGALAGDGDGLTRTVKVVASVASVAWTASLLVIALGTASGREAIVAGVASRYRALLRRRRVVLTLNVVLWAVCAALADQLLFYRPVHVSADLGVRLFLNDEVGETSSLATLAANGETTVRLRVGTHILAYRSLDGKLVGSLAPITVRFSSWDNGHYAIGASDEKKYRRLG